MMIPIHRIATTIVVAGALALAACGVPGTGVETSRSERSTDGPVSSADAPDTTTESGSAPTTTGAPTTTATPPATEPSGPSPTEAPTATSDTTTTVVERPPAPAASGLGSVSADDLASVFLPLNPELLVPSSTLT
ncbi:MAG: hypothetical protein ABJ314_22720, partial [Ilumatobacter sp.]